jgi:glycosyltransferase involved in cell wall biosynthesis
MKIAVYYNFDYGGAKRVVKEQVRGLVKLGHQVDVYTIDNKEDDLNPSRFSTNSYKYHFKPLQISVPFIGRIISDLSIFILLRNTHKKIAHDIDNRKYDVVLTHADFYTQAPYVNKFLRTKTAYYIMEPLRIAHEHALRVKDMSLLNSLYEKINRLIRKNIDMSNVKSADGVLSISYLCKFYSGQVFDVFPTVSYLGVDEKVFKPLNLKKKKQVLFVAPKDYIFGYDLITKAVNLMPKNIRPEIKIVFGVDKKNRLTDDEVVREYNQSIASVSLSRLDTFGLVPLEAMACEVPPIALNMPSYREIISDGENGLLCELDPRDLAEKITFLIENPEIAKEIGIRGRKSVLKNWTWDISIKNLERNLMQISKK